MPSAMNYSDCGSSLNSSYSTLSNYSGATYAPLQSSGAFGSVVRTTHPSFNAVSGYKTGYAPSQGDHACYSSDLGASYGTLAHTCKRS